VKIGILGAGNIGGNLGRRWAGRGHDVAFGVRDAAKVEELVASIGKSGGKARASTIAEAASFGDVLAIAVPWAAVPDVLAAAGDVRGKVLIDATNALKWENGPVHAVATSAAEEIAAKTGAKVVKAFNTLGAEHIEDPVVHGVKADVFLAGDDADAKAIVGKLAQEIGFDVVDAGPLRNARFAEQLAIGWIHVAMVGGLGRGVAFKLLRA
jgi:8-hydroxy-5-deazaflavin:NADPH oxidoreductase